MADAKLQITALTLADTATILAKASGTSITVEAIQRHLDAGAPANADGTISLVAYAAWLVRETARGD